MLSNCIEYKNKPSIWPIPNSCDFTSGYFKANRNLLITADTGFDNEVEIFLKQLSQIGCTAETARNDGNIQISKINDVRLNEEGYILEVSMGEIELKANTNHGIFHGMQTLIQLIENSCSKEIPCVSITDSPFKQIRGIHVYVPPRKDIPWFKRFVDFLSKYKYNTIYMEIGACMKYDTHPEINKAWEDFCKEMLVYPGGPDGNAWGDGGMQICSGPVKNSVHIENGGGSYIEKAEMSELVEYAKSRHIQIIPEVQSFSHSYWLLMAHKDCAERSDDPNPDTYCPSDPTTYKILFDCMQEIIDVMKPKMVHIGHDELQWIGFCDKCKGKTGSDLLAEDINKIHAWLKERGIRTNIWGDKFIEAIKADVREKGMPAGGVEHILYNRKTNKNELTPETFRAIDMIPQDILIYDWYYVMGDVDTGSQDCIGQRGMDVAFGNFSPRIFLNVEDRLRRPNVIGAEVSLWHETSELGMTSVNALVQYLDAINLLWNKSYRTRKRGEYNKIIAQIYPRERDVMTEVIPPSKSAIDFKTIDISKLYNIPLVSHNDYSFIMQTEKLPNTIPFEMCHNNANVNLNKACVLVGDGEDESKYITINDKFRSVAFLHSYTIHLGGPPRRACSYIGNDQDVVGSYIIEYSDGLTESVQIEYAKSIFYSEDAFGAHKANPVYQRGEIHEAIEQLKTSRKIKLKEENQVLFSYEWINPQPEKTIKGISINHDNDKAGGIVLFGLTGVI